MATYNKITAIFYRYKSTEYYATSDLSIDLDNDPEYSVQELIDLGMVVPNPDTDSSINNKTFLYYTKSNVEYSEPTIIYYYVPTYISSDIYMDYIEDNVNKAASNIRYTTKQLNVFVNEHINTSQQNFINNTINNLNEQDSSIQQEIDLVNDSNIQLSDSLDYIEQQLADVDNQIPDISQQLTDLQQDIQSELESLDTEHQDFIQQIANSIQQHSNCIDQITQYIANCPDIKILTKQQYDNIGTPDIETIYYTKEEK